MKKIIVLTLGLLIGAFTMQAQDAKKFVDQDYCVFQDGAVMQYTDGIPKALKESYTLKNGTVINPDGSYMFKNKKKMQLADGECLGMSGKKYKNEQQLFNKQQMHKKKALNKTKTKGKKY